MNFDDNLTEVFDRYLAEQMTEVEEREFLAELERDPSLKQNYEAHRAIVAGIREARKEELKDYIKQNAKIRYLGNIWSQKWVISSAAIVTVLFSAYFIIEFAVKPNQSTKEVAQTTEQAESTTNEADAIVMEDANEAKEPLTDSLPDIKSEQIDAYDDYQELTPSELENTIAEIKKSVPVIQNNLNANNNKASANTGNGATIDVYYEVANSTQYKYDGTKLTLYKFPYQDDVVIYQTGEDKDYMAWRKAFYEIVKDDKAHPLQKLKDEKTIKTLRNLQ